MAKVNDRGIYTPNKQISLNDFFLGTKTLDGKTKSYDFSSVYNLFKTLGELGSQVSVFNTLYDFSEEEASFLDSNGVFNTNEGEVDLENITNIYLNRYSSDELDLKDYFDFLEANKSLIRLQLVSLTNINFVDVFVFKKIVPVIVGGEEVGYNVFVDLDEHTLSSGQLKVSEKYLLDFKVRDLETLLSLDQHISDYENPHAVTKAQVGLGNADNTSDLNKPISIAAQSALDLKYDSLNFIAGQHYVDPTIDNIISGNNSFTGLNLFDKRVATKDYFLIDKTSYKTYIKNESLSSVGTTVFESYDANNGGEYVFRSTLTGFSNDLMSIKKNGSVRANEFLIGLDGLNGGITKAGDSLGLITASGEIAIGGDSSEIIVNNRVIDGVTLPNMPNSWYWRNGTSTGWADFYLNNITANGSQGLIGKWNGYTKEDFEAKLDVADLPENIAIKTAENTFTEKNTFQKVITAPNFILESSMSSESGFNVSWNLITGNPADSTTLTNYINSFNTYGYWKLLVNGALHKDVESHSIISLIDSDSIEVEESGGSIRFVDKLARDGGSIAGDLTVAGNFTVNGTSTVVNSEITTTDRVLLINNGEVGSGVTGGFAGLEIERGSKENYFLGFDESSEEVKVGVAGDLRALLTRDGAISDNGLLKWDDSKKSLVSSGIFVESGVLKSQTNQMSIFKSYNSGASNGYLFKNYDNDTNLLSIQNDGQSFFGGPVTASNFILEGSGPSVSAPATTFNLILGDARDNLSIASYLDSIDNYDHWTFAVNGVSSQNISSEAVLNFIEGDNIEISVGASSITISGTSEYTEGDFDHSFSLKSTTDLQEGTNLYHTAARVYELIDNKLDDNASNVAFKNKNNVFTVNQTFNNNISLIWKDSGGTSRNLVYLDGSNNFYLGGGNSGSTFLRAGASASIGYELTPDLNHDFKNGDAIFRGSLEAGNFVLSGSGSSTPAPTVYWDSLVKSSGDPTTILEAIGSGGSGSLSTFNVAVSGVIKKEVGDEDVINLNPGTDLSITYDGSFNFGIGSNVARKDVAQTFASSITATNFSGNWNGVSASTSSNANTIVQRDASGYVNAQFYYSDGIKSDTSDIGGFVMKNSSNNGYMYGASVSTVAYHLFNNGLAAQGYNNNFSARQTLNAGASVSATSSSDYGLSAVGSSGGARNIFIAGQSGFSNGFTVRYNGTSMEYSMLNGALTVSDSVTASNFIGIASKVSIAEHSATNANFPVTWNNNTSELYNTSSKLTFNPYTGQLNATSLYTSSGATFGGDLTVNGTYHLNSSEPVYTQNIHSVLTSSTSYNNTRITGDFTSAIGYYGIGGSTTRNPSFRDSFVVGTQTAHSLSFNTSDHRRVLIDSAGKTTFYNNVGIGHSPTYKLDVLTNNDRVRLLGTTGYSIVDIQNTGGSLYIGREGATGGDILSGTTAYDSVLASQGTEPIHIGINNSKVVSLFADKTAIFASTVTASNFILEGSGSTTPAPTTYWDNLVKSSGDATTISDALYGHWKLKVNGGSDRNITTEGIVNFIGTDGLNISASGNDVVMKYKVVSQSVKSSSSYTVTSTDSDTIIPFSNTTASVTINSGSLANVDDVVYLDYRGTGTMTIVAGTATLRVNGGRALTSDGQYSIVTVKKISSTEYRVFGELANA